jgi:hypothetical protein
MTRTTPPQEAVEPGNRTTPPQEADTLPTTTESAVTPTVTRELTAHMLLRSCTNEELKQLLRNRNSPVSGVKEDLITRLLTYTSTKMK